MVLLPVYTSYLSVADFGVLAMLTVTGGVLAMLISTPLTTGGVMRFYYHPDYRDRQGVLVFNVMLVLAAAAGVLAGAWWAFSAPVARLLLGVARGRTVVSLYSLVLLLWPISLLGVSFIKLRSKAKLFVMLSGSL